MSKETYPFSAASKRLLLLPTQRRNFEFKTSNLRTKKIATVIYFRTKSLFIIGGVD